MHMGIYAYKGIICLYRHQCLYGHFIYTFMPIIVIYALYGHLLYRHIIYAYKHFAYIDINVYTGTNASMGIYAHMGIYVFTYRDKCLYRQNAYNRDK